MKKIFTIIFALFFLLNGNSAFSVENIVSLDEEEQTSQEQVITTNENMATPLEVEVVFDWLDLSQAKREEQIDYFKSQLFDNNSSKIYFTKDEFKKNFSNFMKDKDFKHHYMLTNNGVTEDETAKYCAFFYKKNTLVMYAIQYKNDPKHAFYYTAFGKMYYTDVMSDEYPNFPYTSMQYDRNGKLKSAIYFVTKDIQYMFGPEKEFQGIWYKDKMYDKNGRQTLTRTNW